MNGYELTRQWYRFASKNKRHIKPIHHALIHWIFEKANQSEWEDEFQLPTNESCEMLGISDKHTFLKALKDLVGFGAVKILQESQNRFNARWITLNECSIYSVKFPQATPHTITHAMPHGTPHATNHATTHATTTNIKPKETNKTFKTTTGEEADEPEFLIKGRNELEEIIRPLREKPENWQQVGKILKQDQFIRENVRMNNKLDDQEYNQAVERFISDQQASLKPIKSESDCRTHFMRWAPNWRSLTAKMTQASSQIQKLPHYDPNDPVPRKVYL